MNPRHEENIVHYAIWVFVVAAFLGLVLGATASVLTRASAANGNGAEQSLSLSTLNSAPGSAAMQMAVDAGTSPRGDQRGGSAQGTGGRFFSRGLATTGFCGLSSMVANAAEGVTCCPLGGTLFTSGCQVACPEGVHLRIVCQRGSAEFTARPAGSAPANSGSGRTGPKFCIRAFLRVNVRPKAENTRHGPANTVLIAVLGCLDGFPHTPTRSVSHGVLQLSRQAKATA